MSETERRQLATFEFFETRPDPRVERTRLHPLPHIMVIALLAMICDGEGWEDMEELGSPSKNGSKRSDGSARARD